MPSKTETFSVRLPDDLRQKVDDLAVATKRSRSFVIKEAVENYVLDYERYVRDLEEAMEDAKSGYGHSHEQIMRWVRSWGTKDELPPPEPDIVPDK